MPSHIEPGEIVAAEKPSLEAYNHRFVDGSQIARRGIGRHAINFTFTARHAPYAKSILLGGELRPAICFNANIAFEFLQSQPIASTTLASIRRCTHPAIRVPAI